MDALDRLMDIMDTLRGPGGCPWDREQTHKSIMKCLIEETYELAEAIEADNIEDMKKRSWATYFCRWCFTAPLPETAAGSPWMRWSMSCATS